jgi:hypothetical protein
METIRPRMKTAAHTVKHIGEAMIASDMLDGEVAQMGHQWLACAETMFAHARKVEAARDAEDALVCTVEEFVAVNTAAIGKALGLPKEFIAFVDKDTRGGEDAPKKCKYNKEAAGNAYYNQQHPLGVCRRGLDIMPCHTTEPNRHNCNLYAPEEAPKRCQFMDCGYCCHDKGPIECGGYGSCPHFKLKP